MTMTIIYKNQKNVYFQFLHVTITFDTVYFHSNKQCYNNTNQIENVIHIRTELIFFFLCTRIKLKRLLRIKPKAYFNLKFTIQDDPSLQLQRNINKMMYKLMLHEEYILLHKSKIESIRNKVYLQF